MKVKETDESKKKQMKVKETDAEKTKKMKVKAQMKLKVSNKSKINI